MKPSDCDKLRVAVLMRWNYCCGIVEPHTATDCDHPIADCVTCHAIDRCWRLRPGVRVGVVVEEESE